MRFLPLVVAKLNASDFLHFTDNERRDKRVFLRQNKVALKNAEKSADYLDFFLDILYNIKVKP